MSILKSELKQLVTHEIGVRVEDAMEVAKKELSALEGKQAAFLEGSKAVEALLAFIDKDLNEEKYGLDVAEVAKRYLMRGVNALQNLSVQAGQYRLAQTGKVQGFDHTVKLLANLIEAEKAKIAALQVAPEASEDTESSPRDRPAGLRPVSIKAARQAEAAAEAAATATSEAVAAPEEAVVAASEVVVVSEAVVVSDSAPVPEVMPTPEAEPEERSEKRASPVKGRGGRKARASNA